MALEHSRAWRELVRKYNAVLELDEKDKRSHIEISRDAWIDICANFDVSLQTPPEKAFGYLIKMIESPRGVWFINFVWKSQ